ncbi:metallophosphoesterase [Streptomyces sp. XD-27]|uniref:metallophosphoesterase family protein n=1 Tax=Streptomyces sp. XD-27 TaxID=3062779 RepID=UPI0026F43F8C|nr:metallophosphoesterase [Streptomyces sp. XD-27]WKX68778.1 metallophosphoesterase [Streptomyces sp. XD-27]
MGGTHRGELLAISDLHVAYEENKAIVERLRPGSDDDWLIVAGDVGELYSDVEWALGLLSERFAKVIWSPGNHELWTHPKDPVQLRGVARYQHLVEMCRAKGIVTPEDPYPVWEGNGGPLTIAPLFLLYDYTFRIDGIHTKQAALAHAYEAGVVCTDEHVLHPDPYPTLDAWCRARVAETEARLAARDPELPTVLINHWPLTRLPTRVLRFPDFALWCGTSLTADWHRRFRAETVVYGHLHIPRTHVEDGVRFQEVSVGYPREWKRHGGLPEDPLRRVLRVPVS